MMKKRSIQCALLSLALVLMLLSGCAAPAATSTPAPAPGSAGATDAPATAPSADDGPFVPYNELLEISVPMGTSPNTFYIEGESVEDNFVTRFYTEKLNIKFVPKWIVDDSKGGEKLTMAVASNDLPDMFAADPGMIGRLIKAEQVQGLKGVYESYASPRLQEIEGYQEYRGFLIGAKDGEHYAMPVPGDFANNVAMYFVRGDWMDKLGLSEPKTMDDLVAIARAFRDNDPDGNGVNDTIPIAMDKSFGQDRASINLLTNPLGAYSAIWIPDGNGKLVYSSIQPEMKEALGFVQGLYAEGLFDLEFAVKDGSKIAEDVAAGKIGIFPGVFWSSLWPLAGTIDNNADADWTPYPIPLNKEGKIVTQNKIAAPVGGVVRADFEHPEALIKAMNLWAEMFHGEYADQFNDMLSTEKYMPIADNWHGYSKPFFFAHPEKNVQLSDNFIKAWEAQDESLLKTGEARNRWEIVKAGGSQGWAHKKFLTQSEPQLLKYDSFVYDEFVSAPTDTMVLRQENLSKLEYEAFMAIIMGDSIDTFDSFVEQWNAQGGQAITAEVNDWYATIK